MTSGIQIVWEREQVAVLKQLAGLPVEEGESTLQPSACEYKEACLFAISVIEEHRRLLNRVIKMHGDMCTFDNCVLDGGDEHCDAFDAE